MAVAVAVDPSMAPCGQCDCVDGVSPIPGKWEIPGIINTSLCPRRDVPADFTELLAMFRHYRNGFLWCAGGVSDQPAIYLVVIQLIETWVNKFSEPKK